MLTIEINGTQVHIDDQTSIDVEFHNQALSEYSTFSFPFTIPATELNLQTTNAPHRLDVQRVGYLPNEFGFVAKWKTFPVVQGTCTVKNVKIIRGKSRIELYVISEKGAFFNRFTNKMLPDVPMDYYEFASVAAYDIYLNDTKDYSYPSRNFAMFPIQATELMYGTYKETEWNTKIKHINRYVPSSPTNGAFYGYRIPQPYLDYVIKKIIQYAGYTTTNDYRYTYSYMAQAVVLCLRYLPMVQLGAAGATDYLKCYTDASTDAGDQPSFYVNDFLPDYNVKNFLIEIQRKYGLRFIVDDRTKSVKLIQLADIVNTPLSQARKVNVEYAYEVEHIDEETGVRMSYSFNDDAHLSAIRDRDKFYLSDTVQSYTDLPPSIGNDEFPFYFVTDENRYYQYDNVTNAWVKRHYELAPYQTSANGYDLTDLEIASIVMFDWTSTDGITTPITIPDYPSERLVYLPTTKQSIFEQTEALVSPASTNTPLTRDMYKKEKPQILWYCGMQPDADNDLYPLGNSSLYDGNGNVISVSYMPSFESLYDPNDSSKNIYNKYHKDFVEWWEQRINVKLKPIITFAELVELDLTQPYWCARLNCYIMFVKIPVRFTAHNIEVGEAEAIRFAEK